MHCMIDVYAFNGRTGIIAGKDFILDVLKRKTPSEFFELKL